MDKKAQVMTQSDILLRLNCEMKFGYNVSSPFFLLVLIGIALTGCQQSVKHSSPKIDNNNGHLYKDIFEDTLYASGHFIDSNGDSVETGFWFISNATNPMVFYGNYVNGLPTGNWNFGFQDSTILSSQWSEYKNTSTKCSFSLPFQYEETLVDSNFFRLRTNNPLLGKISIIVGVRKDINKGESLADFGRNSEVGLKEQGYSFKVDRKELVKPDAKYFFSEYSMKDSVGKNAKLYNIYGYSPSKNHFIEFTFFYEGRKEDLAKIIFNLIVSSIYVDNERYFNPYLG